ncbi:hypothetical protein H0W80_00665 [Candidatus Saccharibacteria bacterium]|nr:hypothetical protein [Candidatus Saccharibacteria bacterium]
MEDSNTPTTPKPAERDADATSFTPAPNPFQQSTVDSDETMAQQIEQDQTPQIDQDTSAQSPLSGVELQGKRAEEKPASGQLPEPKKRSLVGKWLGGAPKKPEDAQPKNTQASNVPEEILMSWQAAEFVQTHKPAGWYLGFGAFFFVLILLAIFTKQYITVGLFALMGTALFIYANRTPRVLRYQLSNFGVTVGVKKYLFDDFGSYYMISDYGQPVLELVPNKRFGTLVSLPPAEHQLDQLETAIGQMLPKVENREDLVDKLFRKLRF